MMSTRFRFLDMKVNDAYTNMAVDESLAKARGENKIPDTLRFYRWKPSAVTLGYFQSVEDEVNEGALRSFGFNLNRRISGGGAVLNSESGEITYSIVLKEDDPRVSKDPVESYRFLCQGLIDALAILGIKAEFKPINDIIVNGRKISGNAQIRRYGAVLHHGTMLVDFDARQMFGVLKISKEKLSDKMIQQAEERVTTIRRELQRHVSFNEVRDALEEGFQKALDAELVKGDLTTYEEQLIREFRGRYSDQKWIYRR
jgi:lipoate---protein ligase